LSLVNLAVFAEDESRQTEGTPIYPLQGEDLYFCVPRVGGHKYQKQIQAIIKKHKGIYCEQSDVDMNEIYSMWLGEYVTDFGGALDAKTNEELLFSRENCRGIFNHKGYQQSLVAILINKASNFEYYLTEEGREAIEELKKR
jgi:hypothetical protein